MAILYSCSTENLLGKHLIEVAYNSLSVSGYSEKENGGLKASSEDR
jgi:hypothetical protein